MRFRVQASTVLVALAVMTAPASSATPGHRMALVIGNTNYANYPALPACAASAELVASQLTKSGFTVTRKDDASNGALGAAFAAFAAQAAAAPDDLAVVYVCAYGGSLDGRDFILPVSATLARASDVMTEGLVARSALSFARGRNGASILALDLVTDQKLALSPPVGTLANDVLPDTASVAIAVETRPPSAATLFAADLAASLTAPDLNTATVLPRLAAQLAGTGGVTIAGVKGAAKLPTTIATPAPPPPAGTQPAPAPAAPRTPLPDDAAMTPSDRRRVQIALAGLGYYDGRLDGIFGADSRAAIRRYQHEIGAPMTGMLSAAQANRLVATAR